MNVGLYIGRRSLAMIAAVFLLLVVVYVCVDTVEVFASFQGSIDAFTVVAYKLPLIAGQMLPASVALGTAAAFSAMRQKGEWVGLGSVGLSPWRLAGYAFLPALWSTALCALLLMWAAPAGLRAMDAVTGSFQPVASDVTWRVVDKVVVRSGLQNDEIVTAQFEGKEGLVWCLLERDGRQCLCWTLNTGWTQTCLHRSDREALFETLSTVPVRAELDPLRAVGSRRGPLELWNEAGILENLGLGGGAFRAELALRVASVAACLSVPALLLALLVTSRLSRPIHVMLLAASLAFGYYAALVVTWNLVVTQAASFYWGALGAPGLFSGCAAAVVVIRRHKIG